MCQSGSRGSEWLARSDFGVPVLPSALLPPPPLFLQGKLPALPGERPTMADWENHLTTIFPEVR